MNKSTSITTRSQSAQLKSLCLSNIRFPLQKKSEEESSGQFTQHSFEKVLRQVSQKISEPVRETTETSG